MCQSSFTVHPPAKGQCVQVILNFEKRRQHSPGRVPLTCGSLCLLLCPTPPTQLHRSPKKIEETEPRASQGFASNQHNRGEQHDQHQQVVQPVVSTLVSPRENDNRLCAVCQPLKQTGRYPKPCKDPGILGCPKKPKSPNFVSQLIPLVFIG